MPHSPSLITSTRPSVFLVASVFSTSVQVLAAIPEHSLIAPSGGPSLIVTVAAVVDTAMRASWPVGAASFTLNVSSGSVTSSSVVAIAGSATRNRSTPPLPGSKSANGSATVSAASAV